MLYHLRQAVRAVFNTPGITVSAIAALSVGIGVSTAIVTLLNAVALQSLPYPNPERLMALNATEMGRPMNTSWPLFRDWQERNSTFEHIVAYRSDDVTVTGANEPVRVNATQVSPDLIPVLGGLPFLGSVNLGPQNVVLSYPFWVAHFAAERQLRGRTLVVDGKLYTISGVLSRGFMFPVWQMMDQPDIYVPLLPNEDRQTYYLHVLGKLRAGVKIAQARADIARITSLDAARDADWMPREGSRLVPLSEDLVSGTGTTITALSLTAVLVLLISCLNVSNLFLCRAVNRCRDMATRAALGASRMRLLFQSLNETVIITVAGAACGTFFSVWALPALVTLVPTHTQFKSRLMLVGLTPDWRVMTFSLACCLGTTLLFGLMPSLTFSKVDLNIRGLCDGLSTGHRVRCILIAVEVAIALVLVSGAGLIVKSFEKLMSVDLGFRARGLLTVDLELDLPRYAGDGAKAQFVESVLQRLGRLPGVRSAAAINALPLTKADVWTTFDMNKPPRKQGGAGYRTVTPAYFETMAIPLLSGRLPARTETAAIVINKTMAEVYFPGTSAVGATIQMMRTLQIRTDRLRTVRLPYQFRIVGVVGDVRHLGLDSDPQPELFVAYSEAPSAEVTFVVRASGDRQRLARQIDREVWAVDHNLPLGPYRTVDTLISQDVAERHFVVVLVTIFAAIAVFLTAAGVFGLVSDAVSRRTREIGVRIALGATAYSIIRLIVAQLLAWAGAGIVVGVFVTLWTGGLLGSYLFAVQPRDPTILASSAFALIMLVIIASAVPAISALRVEPATTLRCE